MRIAIHQPEFMPWPGFFNKMALADLYVVLDNVQFKKRYFENRNQIVSPNGRVFFAGVPVITKTRYTQTINQVEIDNTKHWKEKLISKIYHNYCKAPFFGDYFKKLMELIEEKEFHLLIDLNMALIAFFRKVLGIITPIITSSSLNLQDYHGSDLILQLCLGQRADVYLCGVSGKNYLKLEDFEKKDIQVQWLDYRSPVYGQLCPDFIPALSSLDLLFNQGNKSLDILMHNNGLVKNPSTGPACGKTVPWHGELQFQRGKRTS